MHVCRQLHRLFKVTGVKLSHVIQYTSLQLKQTQISVYISCVGSIMEYKHVDVSLLIQTKASVCWHARQPLGMMDTWWYRVHWRLFPARTALLQLEARESALALSALWVDTLKELLYLIPTHTHESVRRGCKMSVFIAFTVRPPTAHSFELWVQNTSLCGSLYYYQSYITHTLSEY